MVIRRFLIPAIVVVLACTEGPAGPESVCGCPSPPMFMGRVFGTIQRPDSAPAARVTLRFMLPGSSTSLPRPVGGSFSTDSTGAFRADVFAHPEAHLHIALQHEDSSFTVLTQEPLRIVGYFPRMLDSTAFYGVIPAGTLP